MDRGREAYDRARSSVSNMAASARRHAVRRADADTAHDAAAARQTSRGGSACVRRYRRTGLIAMTEQQARTPPTS